jgi:hypothetical protein
MKCNWLIFFLFLSISCKAQKSILNEHISILIYPDELDITASAMPEFKADSTLFPYRRRFEYLLINIPDIHLPERVEERNKLFNLYPDTSAMKRLYLKKLSHDKKLTKYFRETFSPITDLNLQKENAYTAGELMEVASKFFYCDYVAPDTTVIAHICVGINGVNEAQWKKDYTLLQAFCYEAIFNDLDNENSQIWESFVSKKKKSSERFKRNITTLNNYLEDVKLNLFEEMKNDEILKQVLIDYYKLNQHNLAFRII